MPELDVSVRMNDKGPSAATDFPPVTITTLPFRSTISKAGDIVVEASDGNCLGDPCAWPKRSFSDFHIIWLVPGKKLADGRSLY